MDFHRQLTVINGSISSEIQASKSVRFISAEKWKQLMVKVLYKLRKKEHYDINLIDDLVTVIEKMPEQRLIETIMHIQPFRPNFMRKSRRSVTKQPLQVNYDHHLTENAFPYEYKRLQLSNIIKFKQQIHSKVRDSIFMIQQQNPKSGLLEQALTMIRSETTLCKQFQEKYHPFRLVIDQFLFLLEHKYKNVIGSMEGEVSIERIQEMVLFDLNLLQQFVIKASVPYLQIFKSRNKEEKMEFQVQLIAFIQRYLDRHLRINMLIKKILKYAVQSSNMYGTLERKIPNFIEIDRFNVERGLHIQGQYSLSMNSLIEFSQSESPTSSLRKLQEVRQSLLQDVDEYYQRSNESLEKSQATETESLRQFSPKSGLKISVQNQLQILKFLLCKGKIFVADILTQLKYLQTVLGEEDISYKYDDSSFMYAQLVVAIDSLAQQYQ